jgi:uncharacterized protein (DUF3820 family)
VLIDDTRYEMPFGKYKGKQVFELICEDPQYLEWADEPYYNPEVWEKP